VSFCFILRAAILSYNVIGTTSYFSSFTCSVVCTVSAGAGTASNKSSETLATGSFLSCSCSWSVLHSAFVASTSCLHSSVLRPSFLHFWSPPPKLISYRSRLTLTFWGFPPFKAFFLLRSLKPYSKGILQSCSWWSCDVIKT
jgi:hypothetical protein